MSDDTSGLRYVDHEPGMWFLVAQHGDDLLLDARYSYSAVIDDSALIRLDDAERRAYAEGGHDAMTRLAQRIHHSAPYREDSRFHARDLHRGEDGRAWRDAVGGAIAEHTWAAEQRRAPDDR
ncbi:hypothetical protein [Agrococcus jejuensis]|uniref:Uncharacterized protein n=1 Tax=Agrococcus jejuensis TaxID=399736 RepID=A0A1G8G1V8_9MICO|nr:hypothetical protein [Agrococcus jejuensis]SDH88373.1 hypothetical protein SAMN04489720_2721 [Agrococcus jejuensis]